MGELAGSPLEVDSLSMWGAAAGLPEELERAVAASAGLRWGPARDRIVQVAVVGAGASGFAGEAVSALTARELGVPLVVVRSGLVPASVGPGSLVFAVSCSGNTAATVAAAETCFERGAEVVAITAGGALGAVATGHGAPVVGLEAGATGGGIVARAALGATTGSILVVLEGAGLLEGMVGRLEAAAGHLKRRRDVLVGPGGPAAGVARRIGRTFPLVQGTPGPGAAAAHRWKMQVNANAKSPAFWSEQPDLCYDEMVGWGQHGDVTRQVLTLVTLRHGGEAPEMAGRAHLVAEMMLEVVAEVIEVRSGADEEVAAFFDLAMFGDFVSLFMAAQEGVDPGPAPVISEVEEQVRALGASDPVRTAGGRSGERGVGG